MPQFVPVDPVDAFAAGIAQTVALKGHAEVRGDGDTAVTGKPNRIVLQPESGSFVSRNKRSAYVDSDDQVIAWIWGESRAHAYDLRRRLVWAAALYAKDGGPLVEWRSSEFVTEATPSLQGEALTVRFAIRGVPMVPGELTLGLIEVVTISEAS